MTRIPGRAAFWLSAGILLAIPAGSQIRVGTTTGEVRLLKAQPQDDGELVGIMAVADFRRSPTISSRIHVNKEGEYRGEFKFPGLLPGFYKFVVTAKNYRAVAQEGAEVKIKSGDDDNNIDKPKPIDVVRPPQAAGGADRDAHLPLYFRLIREQDSPVPCTVPWPAAAGRTVRDGLPAPGVQVVATVWDGDAGVFQELGADVSGSDGAYSIGLDATRLEKLGSREYILAFQLKGFQPEVRSVERCQQSPAEIQLKPLPPDKRGMFSTTQEAAYRFAYPPYLMENLPVPGVRSFDYMPLLAPGVVAAPFKWTRSGAGVAPGVGTPEQFIINGLRGSENNFTVDGADDNDEELGVRRQGFVNPAPQPLESIGELQLISALADVRYGRGIAAQLNAITASGAAAFHGGVSGFFTDNAFNARDFFTGPGNDPFRRTMASGTLSGPIHKPDSFFFVSYGIIATSAQPQTQFAVPTAAQRGVNGTGETGFSALQIYPLPSFNGTGIPSTAFTPASIPGNAIFSLFPFPNNPEGAYGPNTWTTNLPADQHARQFAVKSDHRLGRAALALRYNRIDENSQLATVGDALDSTIQPRVMNQSVAAYLDVSVRPNIESSFRASFGTTAMSFADRIGRSPLPSNLFPNQPFLLNAPLLLNVNRPGAQGSGFVTASSAQGAVILNAAGVPGSPTSESITGPLGAVWIDGFSPVGVDPYRFPQDRNDRTFQVADLTTAIFGRHTLKAGYDVRFIQLRSNNQRNAAPLAVFSGIQGQSFFGPASPYTSALSMAAMGIPTQMDQTLSGAPLPPLRLTSVQADLFALDDIAITSHLRMQFGLRYGRAPLPYDEDQVISRNFDYASLAGQVQRAEASCTPACPGLLQNVLNAFPGNYNSIFGAHPSSLDARWGAVWDVTGRSGTILRAGAGTYTGTFPALLITESRSGFPWALPLNLANPPSYLGLNPVTTANAVARSAYLFNLANPAVRALDSRLSGLWQTGTLNLVNVPLTGGVPDTISLLSGSLADAYPILQPVQPQQDLSHPWSLQFDFSVEQRLSANNLVRVSYVGTQGRHLLRVTAPNEAPARGYLFYGGPVGTYPLPAGSNVPAFPVFLGDLAPNPVGASVNVNGIAVKPTVFETSGSSNYNSLQVDFRHQYSKHLVAGSSFTWSHAIDNASGIFNNQIGYAYPQDSVSGSDRGSSDFDSRLCWTTHFVLDVPEVGHNRLLRQWQLSGVYLAQSGHPYTVTSSVDVNADGILTDRPNLPSGIVAAHSSNPVARIAIAPNLTAAQLLAPRVRGLIGGDGVVGRNTYVSWGLSNVDLALERSILLGSETSRLTLRAEAFNALNRTQFAPPVSILEAPGFGNAVATMAPARRLQFGVQLHF